jgi:glycerol transport system ATP-binding protein
MSLELRNITKRVGADTHIHETSLVLEPRSFNVLLGTTLAGKTTLMQLMAGIQKPTSGKIFFRGEDVTKTSVQKRNVSMVYQQFINYPNFNVYDNIASPLRVAGMNAVEIERRVGEAAELLRLGPMLKRKPSELSGGQQQRTAIARALVKDSDLILLDEPLANLDYKLREELRDELPKIFSDRDAIVVYATTEPSEALLFGGNT